MNRLTIFPRWLDRERLRRLSHILRSRHSGCLFVALLILIVGVGATMLQTLSITLDSNKIAVGDAELLVACTQLQTQHLDRMHRLRAILRMAAKNDDLDQESWATRIADYRQLDQRIAETLYQAAGLVPAHFQDQPAYKQVARQLADLREKCFRLETEGTSLIRLMKEGRDDEVRTLIPFTFREGEVVCNRIVALGETVRGCVARSAQNIQTSATQMALIWIVVSGLLFACIAWCLSKEARLATIDLGGAHARVAASGGRW